MKIAIGIMLGVMATMFAVGVVNGCKESARATKEWSDYDYYRNGSGNIRSAFIGLNAEFINASNVLRGRGIQVELTLPNVGTAPNSGDGDLIPVAVRKAATNISVLIKAVHQ